LPYKYFITANPESEKKKVTPYTPTISLLNNPKLETEYEIGGKRPNKLIQVVQLFGKNVFHAV